MQNKSRAFTLIELLVVVLIIGILAAVAVPQYQKAVKKSRYATLKPLVKSLAEAERVYYLANGQYTMNFDELDVQLPPHNEETTNTSSEDGTSVTRTTRLFDWGRCYIEYNLVACMRSGMRYSIEFGGKMRQRCYANNIDDNSIENQICKAETGRTTYSGRSIENKYTYWIY